MKDPRKYNSSVDKYWSAGADREIGATCDERPLRALAYSSRLANVKVSSDSNPLVEYVSFQIVFNGQHMQNCINVPIKEINALNAVEFIKSAIPSNYHACTTFGGVQLSGNPDESWVALNKKIHNATMVDADVMSSTCILSELKIVYNSEIIQITPVVAASRDFASVVDMKIEIPLFDSEDDDDAYSVSENSISDKDKTDEDTYNSASDKETDDSTSDKETDGSTSDKDVKVSTSDKETDGSTSDKDVKDIAPVSARIGNVTLDDDDDDDDDSSEDSNSESESDSDYDVRASTAKIATKRCSDDMARCDGITSNAISSMPMYTCPVPVISTKSWVPQMTYRQSVQQTPTVSLKADSVKPRDTIKYRKLHGANHVGQNVTETLEDFRQEVCALSSGFNFAKVVYQTYIVPLMYEVVTDAPYSRVAFVLAGDMIGLGDSFAELIDGLYDKRISAVNFEKKVTDLVNGVKQRKTSNAHQVFTDAEIQNGLKRLSELIVSKNKV